MAPLISRFKFSHSCLLCAAALAAFLGQKGISPAFAQGDGLPSGRAQPPEAAVPRDRDAAASKAPKPALAPKPAPEAMRKQKLDALLDLLHDARKPE